MMHPAAGSSALALRLEAVAGELDQVRIDSNHLNPRPPHSLAVALYGAEAKVFEAGRILAGPTFGHRPAA